MARSNRQITLGGAPINPSPAAQAPQEPVVVEVPIPAPKPATAQTNGPTNGSNGGIKMTNVQTAIPDPRTNVMNELLARRAELLDNIRDFGRLALNAEASLINLAEALVDGAIERVFTVNDQINDATEAYEAFRNPNKGKKNAVQRIDTQSESSFKSNAKKLEWFIKLGQYRGALGKKYFNDAKDVHSQMMADAQERKSIKLKAVYEAVLHLVRKQLSKGEQAPFLTADEMKKELRKEASEQKSAIDFLSEAYLSMKKAYTGRPADSKRGIDERSAIADPTLEGLMKSLYDFVIDLDAANPGMDLRMQFDTAIMPKKKGKKPLNKQSVVAASGLPAGLIADGEDEEEGEDTGDEDDNEE